MSNSINSSPRSDLSQLDRLTGGAFTAPTAGERAARVRAWLQQDPGAEQLQAVYRELSVKDKGAARLLRDRIDEIKRQRDQDGLAVEWAQKAQALLDQSRLNIADALAWQRDAAKAGAPLSREPLATLKTSLAERIKTIEDLQHRMQVLREAAVLLAQRIELLSTKAWQEADAASAPLIEDVGHWMREAQALPQDPTWGSIDIRFAPQLESSRAQLQLVWEAFSAALEQARIAAQDPSAELPQVPVWADALRQERGQLVPVVEEVATRAAVDPALQAQAAQSLEPALLRLEQEISEGHGKASAGAAQALRQALKDHGRYLHAELDRRAHAALAAASELEGWQRWRADQIRAELVTRAEGLLNRPEGQALGGRRMQEALRELREQWKQTDQGGVSNQGLWRKFDEACNKAYKVVEAWLAKVKADAAEHRTQRLALIEELKTWAASQPAEAAHADWRATGRALHQFAERWRNAGHLSEKAYAELQPLWKATLSAAGAALDAAQNQSIERRHALIAEAQQLGAAPSLRIDAVKALQQRWQAEAHAVPLEHRQEQKLWETFRKPIDDAFERRTAERTQAEATLGAHDRNVLDAARALEKVSNSGDAQAIRAAMETLERALHAAPGGVATSAAASTPAAATSARSGDATAAPEPAEDGDAQPAVPASAPAPAPRKPVVAVRGDDRPGARRQDAAPGAPGRDQRPDRAGGRRDAGRDPRRDFGRDGARDGGRDGFRDAARGDRDGRSPRPVRLGDAAFRAQRDALDHGQMALRKLAAQAHGEALSQLMAAWEHRDASQLPSAQELGRVAPAQRTQWSQSLAQAAVVSGDAAQALLRLEMAAEVPSPAEQLDARRALQLHMLTRRNDPSPQQTWGQDVARVLSHAYEGTNARRLQAVLKALLKR